MPLKLAIAAMLMAGSSAADPAFKTQFNHYAGSDGIVVSSPYAAGELELDDRTKVALRYTLDAVSGSSFNYSQSKTHLADPARGAGSCKSCHGGLDAISGATRNYGDVRHDLNFGVTRRVGETDLKPGYIRSQENDYLSETFSFGLEQNLFSRDTTWSLGVRHLSDIISPTWNKHATQNLTTLGASLGLTQVLGRFTVLKAGADYADAQGFQSNPYAFVQVAGLTSIPYPERHPDEKQRLDLSAAFKQALPWDSSAELGYRYYQDSWDVRGQTFDLGLAKRLGFMTVEAAWRNYSQTQAYFFKNFYSVPETYMSRDLKLADFRTDLYSLSLRGELGGGWSTELRYSKMSRQDSLDYRLYFADRPVDADLYVIGFTLQ